MTDTLGFAVQHTGGQGVACVLAYALLLLLNESDEMTKMSWSYGSVIPAWNHTRTALHIAPTLPEFFRIYFLFYLNHKSLQQPMR